MTRSTLALTALLALASPGLALAQGTPQGTPPQQAAPDDRLARTADAYRVKTWPASGPARVGVAPRDLSAPGWSSRDYTVDPRRGEGVARLVEGASGAEVVVVARVLATASEARQELLVELAAGQRVLDPVPGVGEVAFGAKGERALRFLHAVRGNVLFEVRAVARADELGAQALVELAMAMDRLVQAAAPLEPGRVTGPRLLGVTVAPARVGAPAAVKLDLDPAGDPAAHVVFECSGGASVVQTNAGWELFASEPGPVRVTVFAASRELRVARAEVVVQVAP